MPAFSFFEVRYMPVKKASSYPNGWVSLISVPSCLRQKDFRS